MSSAAANPYAAPTARVEDVSSNSEAAAVRRMHIKHEASIKSAGLLYYLGSGLTAVAISAVIGGLLNLQTALVAAMMLVLAIGQALAGWGVRNLRGWARGLGCVISAIGLLQFPIGTLINSYVLYLLLSKKGRTIFSPAYRDVIAATPDIRYRISIVIWIALGLVAVLLMIAVLWPVLAPFLSR